MTKNKNNIYILLLIASIFSALLYMIISLKSDFSIMYNVTEIIGRKQFLFHNFIINNYMYDGTLYIINPGLLTYLFGNTFIIKFLVTLSLLLVYMFLIYKISDMYLNKNQKIVLFLILLCGISRDYMLSIFLYNSFLYQVVIFLGVYYLCFKLFNSNKLLKIIIFTILIILLGINSFYCLHTIIIPYIILELLYNYKKQKIKNGYKFLIFFITLFLLYLFYIIIANNYYLFTISYKLFDIKNRFLSLIDIAISIFGIGNGYDLITNGKYIIYYNNMSNYSLSSIYGITILFRLVFMLFTIVVMPIILIKNKNKNEMKINKLAVFNLIIV